MLAPARVYRYGGEEFTALFEAPVTTEEVDQAGEQAVAAGCAVDPQAALRAIDSSLIRGKAAGRDRYVPLS